MLGKLSVKKPYTVLVAVVLVIVLGVVSFTKMTTDLLPNISLPYVIVMTTYPGASPETVEMSVTKPIESSMATVSNIESTNSVSGENYSMVIMEFAQSTDMNAISLEIREKLDQIKGFFDDSVGNPIIMKLNPDMLPIMVAAVGGLDLDTAELTELTQNMLIPEIESIEGVASASATGLLEESVNVIIRQEKIDEINQKIFASIDEEMKDAEQELAEGRQEIYDGQSELADAKLEMDDSKVELDENKQKLVDSKQKIADGKKEIAENKTKLADGKKELSTKKEEAANKLAEAETKIVTGKADLEATKMHITADVTAIKALDEGYQKAKAGSEQLKSVLLAAQGGLGLSPTDVDTAGLKNKVLAMTTPIEAAKGDVEAVSAGDNSKTYGDIESLLTGDSKILLGTMGVDSSATVSEIIDKLNGSIEKNNALMKSADTYDGLLASIPNMEASINANTMGLGVSVYVAQMEKTLKDIEGNIGKLDAAMTELYKGNLTAAIELANAQSAITIGETQLAAAESQLDAGEEQFEAGEKQLRAGEEQLEKGEKQLKSTAEQLTDALEQLKDGEEQLEEAREDAYSQANMNGILTVETVKSLLTAQNFSMPGGYVTEAGIEYLVRVGDKPKDIAALKKMPLLNMNMEGVEIITLEDVADVFMTDNSDSIYANVNGSPGIMLSIQKQTGYSTGNVSDAILEKFDSLVERNGNIKFITLMDQGIYIDMVMDSIISNVLFGAFLAIFILIIFLRDIRPTAVIACSIPISLIMAIVCMYFSGVTLNVISLSGLALGVGMLVDNSIVVIENIYRLRNEGYSALEASIKGAGEVAGAIMASTLTTVCVFAPIVFTEGITRQLFVDMGLTIAYSLLASLVVALTVVPAMSSKVLIKYKEKENGRTFRFIMKIYDTILQYALRRKAIVVILTVLFLVGSIMLAVSKGTAFMPEMDSTQMTMSISMPKDTPLSDTAAVTDEIVKQLMEMEEIEDVGSMAASSGMSMLTGGDSSGNQTSVYISLKEDKGKTNKEIAAKIEKELADLAKENQAEIEIETSNMDMSAMGGSGVSIQVKGRELDTLQKIAKDISNIVEGIEGTANVTDGMQEATGEMAIVIDRDKAIEYGLTVAQAFQQISSKLADATSTTALETEMKEYSVYVKHAKDMSLTREALKNLEIEGKNQDGSKEKVKLSEIAVFKDTITPKSISRTNQNRYMQVSAEIAEGYNIGLVSQELEKELAKYNPPKGYSMTLGGENETINDAIGQIMLMLLLAVIFMYLIMVAQFQSMLSPFIIMFTIPLAFTGGFLGLFISQSEVSVIALIGFVMLAGIIVNNGIVLVDYINQLRENGMDKKEAIIEAGKTRMRPVFMTALTTILALSTMVFSKDMGADMTKPMAIVTIGGLIYGTLLTLIVIPCIYDIFMKQKKDRKGGIDEQQETIA